MITYDPASTLSTSGEVQWQRRLPVGAEICPAGVEFRVWAPRAQEVSVVLEEVSGGQTFPLTGEEKGYFSGTVPGLGAGARYRYQLDDGEPLPDPASRFQPLGPHGPSQVVDADSFPWTDQGWPGLTTQGQVIYEMHIGTFTREGTWRAAARELPELARLGITAIEIMPVADFSGRFGWGYDGVCLYAPCHLYGGPDDFRCFVNHAHAVGVGVILDVVYNHLGPDGNYLARFSDSYFSRRHQTDWGDPPNFDGEGSGPVRDFFTHNAGYWIDEFHLDGLRLDATQNVYDESPDHVLAAIVRHARQRAGDRQLLMVAENEPQDTLLVRQPEAGGFGIDALWNDDFHHSAMVALTGHSEAYYSDYRGMPQEFVSAARWGTLYQGQWYRWQEKRRGTPALDLPASAFVQFIQNHDQVANSGQGRRIHELTSPGRLRALTALLLLAPQTPMLFQGQEFAASAPFLYFADYEGELGRQVAGGRGQFLRQFASLSQREVQEGLPDPTAIETFTRCKLDLNERLGHGQIYALHRDLLKLRRVHFGRPRRLEGAVLGEEAFLLRWLDPEGRDALLLVNLGADLHLNPAPEPLLAPPLGEIWSVIWSSEDPCYGGGGTSSLENEDNWHIPGQAAVVLEPGQKT